MTDIANEPTAAHPEAATGESETKTETVDYKAEAEKWKALSRQNEAAAKTNAEKAKNFDAIEEANKTEQQRLAERAENAEKALAAKELEADRALVALEKGLTVSQAKRLVGSSRDELLADADQLLTDLGKQSSAPREDPSQGAKASTGSQEPAQAFAEIIRNVSRR